MFDTAEINDVNGFGGLHYERPRSLMPSTKNKQPKKAKPSTKKKQQPPVIKPHAPSWRDVLPTQRKIAIVGKAMDTMLMAPYHDPTWQIWVMNDTPTQEAIRNKVRWDVCFDVHADDVDQQKEFPAHYEWLRKGGAGKPVFMGSRNEAYPESVAYPLADMVELFPRKYLTNSASLMLAMAIACKPECIGIWGVNMSMDSEYGVQRPSCEYYIGQADGRGIPLYVPPESDLLKSSGVYGIEVNPLDKWWKSKMDYYRGRQANAQKISEHCEIEGAFMEGAIQCMKLIKQQMENGRA